MSEFAKCFFNKFAKKMRFFLKGLLATVAERHDSAGYQFGSRYALAPSLFGGARYHPDGQVKSNSFPWLVVRPLPPGSTPRASAP
jgi:hypothetical protein